MASKGKVMFVAVVQTTRAYGGPEEGGWWYDVADTLVYRRCHKRDVENTVRELENGYREWLEHKSSRYEVRVYGKWKRLPRAENAVKPHYE